MKKILIKLMPVLVFLMLIMPVLSFAQTPGNLIPCGTSSKPEQCTFDHLLSLINNVVYFILVYVSIPVAAIMFAYAGIMLITAGEHSEHARTEAKEIFMNTVIGVCFVAGSFLIVKTILMTLGYNGEWFGFDK